MCSLLLFFLFFLRYVYEPGCREHVEVLTWFTICFYSYVQQVSYISRSSQTCSAGTCLASEMTHEPSLGRRRKRSWRSFLAWYGTAAHVTSCCEVRVGWLLLLCAGRGVRRRLLLHAFYLLLLTPSHPTPRIRPQSTTSPNSIIHHFHLRTTSSSVSLVTNHTR